MYDIYSPVAKLCTFRILMVLASDLKYICHCRLRINQTTTRSDDENEGEKKDIELPDGKLGAKKRAKLEAKAEKKAAREAVELLRAEKKKKPDLADKEKRKTEEKERQEEKKREEEERRAKEEKGKREYEEHLKMKVAFSVEEEGFEEGEGTTEQNLLQEFVNYIKTNNVVVIEDQLAYMFTKPLAKVKFLKFVQDLNFI